MLGAIAAGEPAQVGELWKRYRGTFYPSGEIPPYVIYLVDLQ